MIRMDALLYLYSEQKSTKITLGNAERKKGVTPEELNNLQRRLDVLEWLIPLALNADEISMSEQEIAQRRHQNDG